MKFFTSIISKFLRRFVIHPDSDVGLAKFIDRGLSGSLYIDGISKVLVFVSSWMLAFFMGKEGYGTFTYVVNWLMIIGTICTLGLDDFLVREIPKNLAEKKPNLSDSIFAKAVIYPIIVGLGLSIAVYAFDDITLKVADLNLETYVWWCLGAIIFFPLGLNLSSALRGFQHVLSAQVTEKLARPISMVVGAFTVGFVMKESKPEVFVLVFLASTVVGFLIATWLLIRKSVIRLRPSLTHHFEGINKKGWYYFFLLTALGVITNKVDIIILGQMGYIDEAGVYNIVFKLSEMVILGVMLVSVVFGPLFSKYFFEQKRDTLQSVFSSAVKANLIIASILFLLFIFLGMPILRFFGEGFSDGYQSLIMLSGAHWIYALIGPSALLLTMTGFERPTFVIYLLGTLLNIALGFWLTAIGGMQGMAIAKSIVIILMQVSFAFMIVKYIKIKPSIFVKKR